jgi:gamma-glutamylcyclotransferase (GGCT)/AIG2-like uncharacterized protein YtfP
MKLFAPYETKSIYYFAYGANINFSHFVKIGLSFERMGNGILKNYQFSFSLPCEYKGKGFGGVIPSLGTEVHGVLYKLTPSSLKYLDVLEWVPFNFYSRVELSVLSIEGLVTAWIYVPCFPNSSLIPSTGYKNLILKASKTLNFPNDYLEYLASFDSRDSFDIDHDFNLGHPGKSRLLPKILWRRHDFWREKLARLI